MVKTQTVESLCDYDAQIVKMALDGATLSTLYSFLQSKAPHAGESLVLTSLINICARNKFYFKVRAMRTFVRNAFASFGAEKHDIMASISPYSVEAIVNDHPKNKIVTSTRSGSLFDAKNGGILNDTT